MPASGLPDARVGVVAPFQISSFAVQFVRQPAERVSNLRGSVRQLSQVGGLLAQKSDILFHSV